MLAPLLGGSSYTFGLILAVALLGIGVGGLVYAAGDRRRRPTLTAFAMTCALEALCIALPYALGDGVAVIALLQRPAAGAGFLALVQGWFVVTALVVLPAAVIAGYQFPLLIGAARQRRAARRAGGGLGLRQQHLRVDRRLAGRRLRPVAAAVRARRLARCGVPARRVCASRQRSTRRVRGARRRRAGAAGGAGCGRCAAVLRPGPTAFWRHTPIGAGREELPAAGVQANALRQLVHRRRAVIEWEADGVESSVALQREDGLAFLVNGKSDGNAIGDAPTQVMLGLIGAAFHPQPAACPGGRPGHRRDRRLAGAGAVDRARRRAGAGAVDRARRRGVRAGRTPTCCANPKVHIIFGDAREFLLTTANTYDVIVSEPSNPYRAGTASLFTKEFYAAVAAAADGAGRVRAVGAGLRGARRCRAHDLRHPRRGVPVGGDVGDACSARTWRSWRAPRRRCTTSAGCALAWRASRIAACCRWCGAWTAWRGCSPDSWPASALPASYPGQETPINTDDRTVLEFQFARSVGQQGLFEVQRDVREAARRRATRRRCRSPTGPLIGCRSRSCARCAPWQKATCASMPQRDGPGDGRAPARPRRLCQPRPCRGPAACGWRRMLSRRRSATSACLPRRWRTSADERATGYIEALRVWQPADAEALLALWQYRANDPRGGRRASGRRLSSCGAWHPWGQPGLFERALELAVAVVEASIPS